LSKPTCPLSRRNLSSNRDRCARERNTKPTAAH
jgi:hypothetical protein